MPKPILPPIQSAMASHAAYDPHDRSLMVRFKNGDTLKYHEVPANIGQTVTGANSFGGAFNRHVAGKYKATKL